MKAVFTTPNEGKAAINYAGQKEQVTSLKLIGIIKGEIKEIAEFRAYMSRSSNGASPIYGAFWLHCGDHHASGKGKAGGYGYHKESAAMQECLDNAGVHLMGDQYADEKGMHYCHEKKALVKENLKKRARIDGVGSSAMTNALLAIGKACGAKACKVI